MYAIVTLLHLANCKYSSINYRRTEQAWRNSDCGGSVSEVSQFLKTFTTSGSSLAVDGYLIALLQAMTTSEKCLRNVSFTGL